MLSKFTGLFKNVLTHLKTYRNQYINAAYEFEMICLQYDNLYTSNITDDYLYTVVEQNKNEMNYTIKFYYDLLLSYITEAHLQIKENVPDNKYGITRLLTRLLSFSFHILLL